MSTATTTSHQVSPGSRPAGRVSEVDPSTLQRWLAEGACCLVDVREPGEHAAERIASARLMPLSALSLEGLDPAAKLVFHCKAGKRSAQAAQQAAAQLGGQVYTLTGGIDAWKSAGLQTLSGGGPRISVMRQTQMVIGLLLLAGVALAALISPWWLILPGCLGAGLTFAGATGHCGLALALAAMPWNRTSSPGAGKSCAAGVCNT
jgi:rhodanese-related sulfurtransferase